MKKTTYIVRVLAENTHLMNGFLMVHNDIHENSDDTVVEVINTVDDHGERHYYLFGTLKSYKKIMKHCPYIIGMEPNDPEESWEF